MNELMSLELQECNLQLSGSQKGQRWRCA